jgi:hypothetical protein
MNKKLIFLIVASLVASFTFSVFAVVSVGLKEGDWVEYGVNYTGTPPEGYPSDLRIEVQTIQGTVITLEVKRDLLNGQWLQSRTVTFDLENGAPDLLLIPANLTAGDEIYHEDEGTFTLEGVADYNVKGEKRELVYATVGQIEFKWDRETGVLVQADQTTDTFTQTILAYDTNTVENQILVLNSILLYGIIIGLVCILVILALLVFKRKKRKRKRKLKN